MPVFPVEIFDMVIDEVHYGNFLPDTLHRTVVPTNRLEFHE